jgi:hypothetical protein
MPRRSAISRLRRRKTRLVNTQSASTYADEKEKKKKAMMGQLKPGTHALSEIFEYSIKSNVKQMPLPLFKDFRNVFEKQGDRLETFRKFARKKKLKNPDSTGEKMYHAWAKKHGVKHNEGNFRSLLGNED